PFAVRRKTWMRHEERFHWGNGDRQWCRVAASRRDPVNALSQPGPANEDDRGSIRCPCREVAAFDGSARCDAEGRHHPDVTADFANRRIAKYELVFAPASGHECDLFPIR